MTRETTPPTDAKLAALEFRHHGEMFNVTAILRELQREHDATPGGSERTFIALVMRLIRAQHAALSPSSLQEIKDAA